MTVKYVALDVHQASTSISVRDARGRVIQREVVPTSAARERKIALIRSITRVESSTSVLNAASAVAVRRAGRDHAFEW